MKLRPNFKRNIPQQMQILFNGSAEQTYYDDLPYHPYVSNDLKKDGLFRVRRDKALSFKTIQHNPNGLIRCIVFDIDKPFASHHWYDENCPAPNWVLINPENGHCHYIYMLSAPIPTTDASKLKPQKYVAAIERALALKLNADINYVGLVSKNPLSDHWRVWKPRDETYELRELEEYVDLSTLPKVVKRESDGLSRHCILFDELRYWAYSRVTDAREKMTITQWIQTLNNKAEALNTFKNPLPYNSLRHTAKSVGNWTWSKYTGGSNTIRRGRDSAQNMLLEVDDKQRLAGHKTNQQQKQKSERKIVYAIKCLQSQNKAVSIRSVAKCSGLAKSTVERFKSVLVRCTSDNHR